VVSPQEVGAEGKNWWQKVGDFFTPKADNIISGSKTAVDAVKVKDVNFTRLDTGMVSVNASGRPPGMRADYLNHLDDFNFPPGGNYLPGTIASRTGAGLIKGSIKGSSWVTAGVVSTVVNFSEYGKDPTQGKTFWDRTVKNREFWVSTAVDTALSVAVGLAATAVVAAVVTAFTITAPLTAAVVVTGALAIGISIGLEYFGVPNMIEGNINDWFDGLEN